MRSEQEVRKLIASFLRCEAFELRFTPDVAEIISELAERIESEETIEELLANVGARGQNENRAS